MASKPLKSCEDVDFNETFVDAKVIFRSGDFCFGGCELLASVFHQGAGAGGADGITAVRDGSLIHGREAATFHNF